MLDGILKPENCHILKNAGKEDALNILMDGLNKTGRVKDLDALRKEIFYREDLMSTGVGLGIAIPHVRFYETVNPVVAVGIQTRGIPDYQSIDGETVKIVVMIVVGKEQHKQHLQILSRLMTILKEQSARDTLAGCKTGAEVFQFFTSREKEE